MSITSIFTRTPPRIGINDEWITFDAVIEDALEFTVDYTQFPIEIGADASDHGIIRPATQVMTVSVSNNPLSFSLIGSAAGFVSNFIDSAAGAAIAGLSAGFLSGAEESRAKSVLEFFVSLMYSRIPFDVDSVDYMSKNMVITKLRRTRNISNESGLDLIIEMQELPLLSTTISNNQPSISQLNNDDPSQTQAAATKEKGEVLGVPVSASTQSVIEGLL
jgi:hypothetical protein